MKADLNEILRLLKAAKESELEAIEQLQKLYGDKDEEEEKKMEKKASTAGKGKGNKASADEEEDLDSMNAAQLYKLCCQRGLSGKCKDRKKATLIAVLNGAGVEEEPKTEPETAEDDDWEDEPEEKNYDDMSAKELYQECMDRGIKCEKRLKPAAYIKLLKEDDQQSEGGEDSDDWEL